MIQKILGASLLLTSFGFIASMGSCVRSGNLPFERSTVRIQLHSEPVSLDPALAEDGLGFRVITNLYRGLTTVNQDGEVVGDLAELISLSSDRLTYRYRLKPDATWSDGTRITPEEVRYGIERSLRPNTLAKYALFLEKIRGVSEWKNGKASHISGIELKGSDEIHFVLQEPFALLPGVLTLPLAFPMKPEFFDGKGRFDLSRKDRLLYSAPYRLKEYVRDGKIVLERWKTGSERTTGVSVGDPPKIVEFIVVRDESTALSLFQNQKLDILTKVPPYDIARLRKDGSLRVFPYAATYFLGFNLRDPRVKDVAVRRRVRDAIRREELVRVTDSGESPAYSFIPPGFEGFWEYPRVKPEASKKPLSLSITFDGTERNQALLEKIQSDLKSAGITAELRPREWKTHTKEIYSNPNPLYRFGWSTPVFDPVFFLLPFDSQSGFALGGLPEKSLHPELLEILSLPSGAPRRLKIEAFQKKVLDDEVWAIPLFHYVSSIGVSQRISEFPVNRLGSFRLEDIRTATP